MTKPRVYTMYFAKVYSLYVAKAEKKGRKKAEVDTIICWLTGYSEDDLESLLQSEIDLETFISQAPKLNPKRFAITGVVCGVRVEEIKDPIMQEIRRLDKLIDELARGKALKKVLREEQKSV